MNDLIVGYPKDAKPHLKMNHIDGPLLCLRYGGLHWLTISERIAVFFGLHDEYSLERKWWGKV